MIRAAALALALLSLTGCAVPVAVWTAAASGLTATGVILKADVQLAQDYVEWRNGPQAKTPSKPEEGGD